MASDIDLSQVIFRKLPKNWHPYIKLARFDRPIGIWLLLFPCLWGIVLGAGGIIDMTYSAWRQTGLFILGAILMRAAGCVVNDLWDIRLDASVERTKNRPLASGEMSVAQACRFLGVLLFLSFLVLIMLPHIVVVLGVLSLLLVISYPYMKRITWVPQLFLGLTFNWGTLMGYAAVTGHLSKAAFLLYLGGIFWTLGYDTIYAHQDVEDDIRIGVKSTARLFGKNSKLFVSGFYALSLLFLLMAKYAVSPGLTTPMLTGFAALYAVWQMKEWQVQDPLSSLKMFKANQIYGWLILLMLMV